MEIGSFIELQLPKGLEYYKGEKNIARLNSGRAAIWHAFRLLDCSCVWLPIYQCGSVREFLLRKNVSIKYYHIDRSFLPVDIEQKPGEAVLLVNYFGIMSDRRMRELASRYKNVIIDNSQAFYAAPIDGCMNVYSCRKFIGVPDGAYVIGENAERFVDEYEQCFSSDTSLFLLQRIEYGCEGRAYANRTLNEERIDREDCMRMSALTRAILDGTDHEFIISKRRENFAYAERAFGGANLLELEGLTDGSAVPMVYPLVIMDENAVARLQKAKHFQGRWWHYITLEQDRDCFECFLSRFMIPITIDQRCGLAELEYIKDNCL